LLGSPTVDPEVMASSPPVVAQGAADQAGTASQQDTHGELRSGCKILSVWPVNNRLLAERRTSPRRKLRACPSNHRLSIARHPARPCCAATVPLAAVAWK